MKAHKCLCAYCVILQMTGISGMRHVQENRVYGYESYFIYICRVSRSLVALCAAYILGTFLTRLLLHSPVTRSKTKHMEQECFFKIYFPLANQ